MNSENFYLVMTRLAALIGKELRVIWKDPKSRTLIIAMPLVQLLVFSNAITMEVNNIELAVLDCSKTSESRELISGFVGSPRFKRLTFTDNIQELRDSIAEQRAAVGLIIPADFAVKVSKETLVTVQVIADGRQTNSASMAASYVQQIVAAYSAQAVPIQTVAVNLQQRNWYNDNLDYRLYLMQSIVCTLSIIVALLLTALSVVREKENGTFERLVISPLTAGEILLGKLVPPFMISFLVTSAMTAVVVGWFNVPMRGSLVELLLLLAAALLAVCGVGLFISSLCRSQQQAILGVMTFQIPAIMLSGFISPIQDMPPLVQQLTYLNPLRFYMAAARDLFFKGISWSELFANVVPLVMISCVTLGAAAWLFKRRLG